MRTFISLSTLFTTFLMISVAWSCNTTTYQGCTPEEMRAIQQQQFYGRKYQPSQPERLDPDTYWRDRQYADRVRAEERNHELELEKMRFQTEVEVVRQEKRSRYYTKHYYYNPPSHYRPPYRPPGYHRPPYRPPVVRPVPPIAIRPVGPPPKLKGNMYSQGSKKKVSRGIQ